MKEKDNESVTNQAAGEQPVTTTATASAPATTTTGAATQAVTQEGSEPGAVVFPFAAAGTVFTSWFNEKLRQLSNPTLMLGTKRARVIGLHEDGRLQVEIETEALEPERQFVAFESLHLDQLVRKIAALGL